MYKYNPQSHIYIHSPCTDIPFRAALIVILFKPELQTPAYIQLNFNENGKKLLKETIFKKKNADFEEQELQQAFLGFVKKLMSFL